MKKKLVRFYRTSSKSKLELLPELEENLIGLMLGDLHAERIKPTSNTRLQFKQSIKNEAYILHLYSIFKDYCNSEPKITTSIEKRINKKEINTSIKFWTASLPCFNKFRELFYNDLGIKYIPNNLEDLITSRSLAYWVMDDGYNSRVSNGFYFCTESFTLEDNYKLKNILKSKFNLDCGIHKHSNGYRLYVISNSKDRLYELVKPHLISHFYYKFNKQSELQE
uniref:LAGLIDADG homing endonuclease n=1 Tax=Cyathus stercoreus TaxID=181520 RepID=UPI002551DFC6|nr:LAGLIDADG homing endonuclease [Cyathus stercoreus]WEV87327.1 LAGLIDADG homing endonuclease [Cyathus stercoreus]